MKRSTKQIIILLTCLIGIIFIYSFIYNNYYLGDYIVQEQWIGSDYNNQTYCSECLWIKFSEGCNRYPVYYFENQHEFDERLEFGKVVNINFNGEYIKGVSLAHKYRTKCFSEIDYIFFYLFLIPIIILFSILYILILTKLNNGNDGIHPNPKGQSV